MRFLLFFSVLALILVNGWTDAPNAIAGVVATGSMSYRAAAWMAAACNLAGALFFCLMGGQVAKTILNLTDFSQSGEAGFCALAGCFLSVVLFAAAAWYWGIPTSESHALIAGITGAAVAIHGNFSGINASEWGKVLFGIVLSTLLGFAFGFLSSKLTVLLFRDRNRMKSEKFFSGAQIAGGAAMAFMHGAQDGQKFMAIFLLGASFAGGHTDTVMFTIPLWLMIMCSAVMGLGTSIGGYRIIKSVGMDMVKLKPYQGFAADFAATLCLLLSSLTGLPVSTTHTKTTAVMGVGAARRLGNVNWSIVKELILTWVFTFPGCGLLGYLTAKLFLLIFA